MARKAISKKLRFDVFKRDGFVCQYCGSHPPSVILHVDHIDPVANGGKNNIDNLITSCEPCNLGKGAALLSSAPKSLKEKSEEVAEREAQLKEYNAILQAKENRLSNETWDVAAILDGKEWIESYNRADLISIKRFLEKLPFVVVKEAAEIAFAHGPHSEARRFKYFCAICWNQIRNDQ